MQGTMDTNSHQQLPPIPVTFTRVKTQRQSKRTETNSNTV